METEGGEEGTEVAWVAGEKAVVGVGEGANEDVGDGALGGGSGAFALDLAVPGAVGGEEGVGGEGRGEFDAEGGQEGALVGQVAVEGGGEFDEGDGGDEKSAGGELVEGVGGSEGEVGVGFEDVDEDAGVDNPAHGAVSASRSSAIQSAVRRGAWNLRP